MSDGLISAAENVLGTAMAIAALIVGRRLERRYAWLLDDEHHHETEEDTDATGP